MNEVFGSQIYLMIPEDKWQGLVPAFISQQAYPDQSVGWFEGDPLAWVRPTWEQAVEKSIMGPARVLVDTGRTPNITWRITKFLNRHHPPLLQYPDGSRGILEVVANDTNKLAYGTTPAAALDMDPVPYIWLTHQEAHQVIALARMNDGS